MRVSPQPRTQGPCCSPLASSKDPGYEVGCHPSHKIMRESDPSAVITDYDMSSSVCSEAGKIATGGTCRRIVVSTLAEADFYFQHGFDDINFAYPITPDKLPQAEELLLKLEKFHIMVDSMAAVQLVCEYPLKSTTKNWSVFLEVDAGYGRS